VTVKVNLLGKTELWIRNIRLEQADLNKIAAAVSDVLGLRDEEVFVTDASDDHITLDILRTEMDAERLYGKKEEILGKLASIPGVGVTEETTLHSEGILGFISLNEDTAREVLDKSEEMAADLLSNIQRRCMIFPTGEEVRRKLIKDTNSPYIRDRLASEGFKADVGPVLRDDTDSISAALSDAIDRGFGLIITTGGVGAESKDRTVEAMMKLDREAATPYVTKYHKGTGRHEKEGVRIAVGSVGPTLMIALPGPNDEVRMSMETIVVGLKNGYDKRRLADEIAKTLKSKYVSGHESAWHHQ
jgi:molybdenum cofactor synthesis domain-containing protein